MEIMGNMSKRRAALLIVGLPALAVACCVGYLAWLFYAPTALGGMRICSADWRTGLSVEIVDDATGAAAAEGAVLEMVDGTYKETSKGPPGSKHLGGAHERPGRYELRVRKPGYEDWTASVLVGRNDCHVITEFREARLVKSRAGHPSGTALPSGKK